VKGLLFNNKNNLMSQKAMYLW